MDAITLLKQDHRTVEALFARYEGGLDTEEKRAVVDEIIRELSIHAAIEEQFLYPAMREAFPKGEDMAEEGIDEHGEVKETLSDLDGMDPSEPGFDPKVRSLIGDVRHHVEEEENEMFPNFQSAVSADRLEELGGLMERGKASAPTRPHPHAPSTPPGNLVVGPVAGAIDRARDAVSGRPRKPSAKKTTAKKTATGKSSAKRSSAKASSGKKPASTSTKRAGARRATTRGPVIHVTPARDGGWRAERRGSNRAVAKSDSKQEVVKRAREVAKSQSGRLVIHKADGKIQEERTYGDDPRRSRG